MPLGKLKNLTLKIEVNISNHKTQNVSTFNHYCILLIPSAVFIFKLIPNIYYIYYFRVIKSELLELLFIIYLV